MLVISESFTANLIGKFEREDKKQKNVVTL